MPRGTNTKTTKIYLCTEEAGRLIGMQKKQFYNAAVRIGMKPMIISRRNFYIAAIVQARKKELFDSIGAQGSGKKSPRLPNPGL